MTNIFEHTDTCGDRTTVETGGDGALIVRNSTAARVGVILDAEAVDRLRDALKPYGTRREAPAATVEVGKEYRLLPGAKFDYMTGPRSTGLATSGTGLATSGTTRVIVTDVRDSYGNATVTAVDGVNAGTPNWSVAPRYLVAPLSPVPAPGTRARVVGDAAKWYHKFKTGEVVELVRLGDVDHTHAGTPRGWLCQGDDGDEWYVHATDLEPLDKPATLATDDAVSALRERMYVIPEGHETAFGQLDPARVAAAREAMAILGEDGASVDLEALLALAEFLIGEAK